MEPRLCGIAAEERKWYGDSAVMNVTDAQKWCGDCAMVKSAVARGSGAEIVR